MRYSLRLLVAVVAVLLAGCSTSTPRESPFGSPPDSSPSYSAAPASAPTYQQEPIPPRPLTDGEKQAYIQRFSADMSELQRARAAAERQQRQRVAQEAAVPPPTGGYEAAPPPAPAPTYSPPPASYGGEAGGFTPAPTQSFDQAPYRGGGFGSGYGQPSAPPGGFAASAPAGPDDPNRTVYVTRTGGKYHADGCQYLRRSQIGMKWQDAVRSYSACSRCGGG